MFGGLSAWHWLVVLIVALLLFGNRLPEVARSMGKAVMEFKRGLRDMQDGMNTTDDEPADGPPPRKLRSPEDSRKAFLEGEDEASAPPPRREPTGTVSRRPRSESEVEQHD